jgi:hypothetical protein
MDADIHTLMQLSLKQLSEYLLVTASIAQVFISNKKMGDSKEKELLQEDVALASISEVFSFADTLRTKIYIACGIFFAVIAGLAFPASIFYFTRIMGDISAVKQEGLDPVLNIIYARMILGVVSLVSETLHSK